jgi:hypothetical protein
MAVVHGPMGCATIRRETDMVSASASAHCAFIRDNTYNSMPGVRRGKISPRAHTNGGLNTDMCMTSFSMQEEGGFNRGASTGGMHCQKSMLITLKLGQNVVNITSSL